MTFSPAPKPQPTPKKQPKQPRAKNAKRSADQWTRAYGSEARADWITTLPCVVSGCRLTSENVHIEGDGTGRKADADKICPMCRPHHRELHREGRTEFEGKYYLDLAALALDTERIWRRITNTVAFPPPSGEELR